MSCSWWSEIVYVFNAIYRKKFGERNYIGSLNKKRNVEFFITHSLSATTPSDRSMSFRELISADEVTLPLCLKQFTQKNLAKEIAFERFKYEKKCWVLYNS